MMVRDFQSVIGRETKAQCLARFGALPDIVVACVGGGSNAIGIFNVSGQIESLKLTKFTCCMDLGLFSCHCFCMVRLISIKTA